MSFSHPRRRQEVDCHVPREVSAHCSSKRDERGRGVFTPSKSFDERDHVDELCAASDASRPSRPASLDPQVRRTGSRAQQLRNCTHSETVRSGAGRKRPRLFSLTLHASSGPASQQYYMGAPSSIAAALSSMTRSSMTRAAVTSTACGPLSHSLSMIRDSHPLRLTPVATPDLPPSFLP